MTTTGSTRPRGASALAGVPTLALSAVAFPATHGEPGEVQWWDLLTEDAAGAAQFYWNCSAGTWSAGRRATTWSGSAANPSPG